MIPTRYFIVSIVLLFLLVFVFRARQVFSVNALTHDGSIAYCAAAGQHNAFMISFAKESSVYGHWTPVENWKRFLRVEKPFCFG